MSLLVRIEEVDLDLNLDQVNGGEKYKTGTEGCEDYVPARRKAAAGMGAKGEYFQYHDTNAAHYLQKLAAELWKKGTKRDDHWRA